MNEGQVHIPPVGIGEVMRAGGIGKVIASDNPKFAVGDVVTGSLGVQEYASFDEVGLKRGGIAKIDLRAGTIGQWLNVLGMPGMTGYFGLMDIGQPKEGERSSSPAPPVPWTRPSASSPRSKVAASSASRAAPPSATGW